MLDEYLAKIDVIRDTPNVDKLCHLHSFNKADELFLAIGMEKIVLGPVDEAYLKGKNNSGGWRRLLSFGRKKKDEQEETFHHDGASEKIDKKQTIVLTDDNVNKDYILDTCCSPIPGDPIMAYLDVDNTIHIHKLQCPSALKLKANQGNRIMTAKWAAESSRLYQVTIQLSGIDKVGLLNQITQVISHLFNLSIRKLEIETDEGIFEGKLTLFVHNTAEVKTIVANLKKIQNVKEVARI